MANNYQSTLALGALFKSETDYGVANVPAPSDFIGPTEQPKITSHNVNDGSVGFDARSGGKLLNVRQSGLTHSFDFKSTLRSNLTPYSATETPRDIHKILRYAGLSATYDVATGWTYTPEIDNFSSATVDTFTGKKRYRTTGAFVKDLSFDFDGAGVVHYTASFEGIGSNPVDAGLPDVSAYNYLDPSMKWDGRSGAVVVGTWSPKGVRKGQVKISRPLTARPSGTVAGGHAGYAPGAHTFEITMTVEQVPLSTWDPYALKQAGSVTALTIPVGDIGTGLSGLGAAWNFPTGQIADVQDGVDGTIATWELKFHIAAGPAGLYNCSLVFP
jgi:hypothetical protein